MHQTFVRWLVIIVIVASDALPPAPVWAQQAPSRQCSVQGYGSVRALPTSVEVVGLISADAELAGDALTKFRSAKEAALAAMKQLDIANLTVEVSGLAFGPSTMNQTTAESILNRARGVAPEPPKVQMQETLRLRLADIDQFAPEQLLETLAKLVDAGQEAGVKFGASPSSRSISSLRDEPATFVTFRLDNSPALRKQAEEQALQDARATAARLAELSGLELGEINSVQAAVSIPSSLRNAPPDQSSRLEEIEISVTLQVQFALRSPGQSRSE